MLHLKGRGFNKFVHTIEFETIADDGVPDTGRRRTIIDAIAPDQPEGAIFSDMFMIYSICQLTNAFTPATQI